MANIYEKLKAGTTPLMAKFKNPTQATWERYTRTPDGGGGFTKAWVSQGAINIILLPASSAERMQADRLQTEITHIAYFLYDDASTITTKDRIVFDSRNFNVVEFLSIAEGDMWVKARMMEGVAA